MSKFLWGLNSGLFLYHHPFSRYKVENRNAPNDLKTTLNISISPNVQIFAQFSTTNYFRDTRLLKIGNAPNEYIMTLHT